MNATTLMLYASACAIGALVPGPTSLLAMNHGATGQWRAVRAGMLGAALSDILVIASVGAGLGALLHASESLFSALRWAGVAYLVWLAIQLWRSPVADLSHTGQTPSISARSAFARSFLVALSNPKVLLFFTAFLPQFIDPGQPALPQYAALALLSAGIDVAVMAVYASGGVHAARMLSSHGMKFIHRASAGAMLVLASMLLFMRRSDS